ncbi:hypothetical protein SELMODRAFT_114910, partial [Selaginella moellendorffii]
IYRLKQPPRIWYNTLQKFFLIFGFSCAKADWDLYYCFRDDLIILVCVYIHISSWLK